MGTENRVGFIPGFEAEGVEDGVDTALLLHDRDPFFVGVDEGVGAEGPKGLVVSLGGGAVNSDV